MEIKPIYQHGYEDGLYDTFNPALEYQEEYIAGFEDGHGDRELYYGGRIMKPGSKILTPASNYGFFPGDILVTSDNGYILDPMLIHLIEGQFAYRNDGKPGGMWSTDYTAGSYPLVEPGFPTCIPGEDMVE